MNYTKEQQAVLDADGKIIVSASAGSGKTFIMIERIMKKIMQGTNINQILAVTYTKKAAAQMREKIRETMIEKINDSSTQSKQKEWLKEQLSLLPTAEISTLHAFCSHLLKKYFFLLDIDSNFEIISNDDAFGKDLSNQALDEIFDSGYSNEDKDLFSLLSIYYRGKKDDYLRKMVLDLYNQLRNRSDYRQILQNSSPEKEKFQAICNECYLLRMQKIKCLYNNIEKTREELTSLKLIKSSESATEILDFLRGFFDKKDYFSLFATVPSFARKQPTTKMKEAEKTCIEKLSDYKEKVKKLFSIETMTEDECFKNYNCAGQMAQSLCRLILLYDDAYTQIKREKGKLDYNDLEHLTLRLLSQAEIVQEIKSRFEYIYVDEYQDVNPVQEEILSKIYDKNVFLVGDVKQSIYSFRGSKSRFFLEKQVEFSSQGYNLNLKANFRSTPAVLSFANRVFSPLMTKENCEIDYCKDAIMESGGGYGSHDGKVTIHFYDSEKKEKAECKGVYSVKEHLQENKKKKDPIGEEIYSIIDEELHGTYYDLKRKIFKPTTYADIVILTRQRGKDDNNVQKIMETLIEKGVPVTTSSEVNICEYPEIRQLIDILSYLDNREQDIPFCSALLSDMGKLNNEELSKIRLRYPSENFRNACRKYGAEMQDDIAKKLQAFYEYIGATESRAQVLTAAENISRIVSETGMEIDYLSKNNGQQRLRRIRRFQEEAADMSIHEFLQHIRHMEYNVGMSELSGENAVRIMTMHASKGLEAPIVILADLDKSFHGAEHSEGLYDDEFGVALRCYDQEKMEKKETVLRDLIKEKQLLEEKKNELNLFYVAITRAKYNLHLIVNRQNIKKYDWNFVDCQANFLDFDHLQEYFEERPMLSKPFSEVDALVVEKEEEMSDKILSYFQFQYPYLQDTNLPFKSSASAFLHQEEMVVDENTFQKLEGEDSVKASKSEVGTAYHRFLECADFTKDEKQIEDMVKQGQLSLKQKEMLSQKKLAQILSLPIFSDLAEAELYREKKFIVNLPAKEFFSIDSQKQVVFQGAIDLLAITKKEVRIIDYKFSDRTKESILSYYAPQLKLYRAAVAKILKIKESTILCDILNIKSGEVVHIQ